jgi:hypothetical protein
MSTSAVPGPVRHFLAGLDNLRPGEATDMDQVGRLLVELATDRELLNPLIAQMPAGRRGAVAGPARARTAIVDAGERARAARQFRLSARN